MILKCPKCTGTGLVNAPHGTSRCPTCEGMFVPRGHVAELLDAGDVPPSARSAEHDSDGGQCPEDRAIMSRTRIEVAAGAAAIHLERCPSCRGVWFDAGEWQLLASGHLLEHLDELWTAEWRASQRRQLDRSEYERRTQELFGPELYAQILALAAALRAHPRRSQALAIIREESQS
jgi:Zn-finger nucleic acid-binding protein